MKAIVTSLFAALLMSSCTTPTPTWTVLVPLGVSAATSQYLAKASTSEKRQKAATVLLNASDAILLAVDTTATGQQLKDLILNYAPNEPQWVFLADQLAVIYDSNKQRLGDDNSRALIVGIATGLKTAAETALN